MISKYYKTITHNQSMLKYAKIFKKKLKFNIFLIFLLPSTEFFERNGNVPILFYHRIFISNEMLTKEVSKIFFFKMAWKLPNLINIIVTKVIYKKNIY